MLEEQYESLCFNNGNNFYVYVPFDLRDTVVYDYKTCYLDSIYYISEKEAVFQMVSNTPLAMRQQGADFFLFKVEKDKNQNWYITKKSQVVELEMEGRLTGKFELIDIGELYLKYIDTIYYYAMMYPKFEEKYFQIMLF